MALLHAAPVSLTMWYAEAGKVPVYAYDTGDSNNPETGDAANISAEISIDGGASAATTDTNPTELDATDHPGIYLFDVSAAEMTGSLIVITPVSSTGSIELAPVVITTRTRAGFKKNTAYANFTFEMLDVADGRNPKTGETITGEVSLDGAAFASLTNSVSEIGSTGRYKVALAAADLNGDHIHLKFTNTNCIPLDIKFKTEP